MDYESLKGVIVASTRGWLQNQQQLLARREVLLKGKEDPLINVIQDTTDVSGVWAGFVPFRVFDFC